MSKLIQHKEFKDALKKAKSKISKLKRVGWKPHDRTTVMLWYGSPVTYKEFKRMIKKL